VNYIRINNIKISADYIDPDDIVTWLNEKTNNISPNNDMRPRQGLDLDRDWSWDWENHYYDHWILKIKDEELACEFKLRFL